MDHHGEVGRLLGGGHAERAHFLGQLGQRLGHPVLHLHLGLVGSVPSLKVTVVVSTPSPVACENM
jgi:hypothetical protein